MPARTAAVLGAAIGVAVACSAISASTAKKEPGSIALAAAVSAAPPPPPAAPPPPPALKAPSAVVELAVEGHLSALVSLPLGTTERRPVAVVTHGNWGGPQWDCPLWRGIVGGEAFILCPRGVPRRDQDPPPRTPSETAYTYDTAEALAAEIDAGLAALRSHYGEFIAEGPVLYAGCSRGAYLGAILGPRDPAKFSRLALVEGGHDPWTPEAAQRFARGGGSRVLFTCGQYACYQAATARKKLLAAAGVEAEVAYAPLVGHLCHDRVADETKKALPWLTEGDARWEDALE